MLLGNVVPILPIAAAAFFLIRLLFNTSLVYSVSNLLASLKEKCHAHQIFKVPNRNGDMQDNQLYRKVLIYLNSSISLEESDYTNLLSSGKSNEITLCVDTGQCIRDTFLGSRVSWKADDGKALVLTMRKSDRRRILRPYLQHIHAVADEIQQRRKEAVRLHLNDSSGCWRSVPFNHPATFDTIVLDEGVKNRVKADLELFLRSKQYYHRLGRVWKRSYLLYGPLGTGKTSFAAAMAKFLGYDIHDIDLSRVSGDLDLKLLLLRTSDRSLVLIEDLDRFLTEESPGTSLSGVLNFMDGIVASCWGEERVMVFTMNRKDQIDPSIMRPGRIDVHVHFPLCDSPAFRSLANSYLGLKDHKLFAPIEETLRCRAGGGGGLSPAEMGEIMLSHRNSPNKALKSVMAALRSRTVVQRSADPPACEPDDPGSVVCRESIHVVREFRKLYGLLRLRSGRRDAPAATAVYHDLRPGEKSDSSSTTLPPN